MKTSFKNSFLRDLKDIRDPGVRLSIEKAILQAEKAVTLKEISHIKPISGVKKQHFRIRIGNYRIGLCFEDDILYFVRCLPRKDIYTHFP
ncbi:MAG: type II toxin-antitoxin system RelE/ParE family toxin [Bacteroidetes bacterium]|nr:type II toxin-antitoxin system RelE/ParE family toxin [Bacteroidota bacterium]